MPDALIVTLVLIGLVGLVWVFVLLLAFANSCVEEVFPRDKEEE